MFRKVFQKGARGQAGQSLVEFALGLPILVLLTLGIIDLSRAVYTYNTLSEIAREGARFGIVLTDASWDTYYGHDAWHEPGNRPQSTPYTLRPYVGTQTVVGKVAAQRGILDLDKTKVTISVDYGPEAHLRQPFTVKVETPFTPAMSYLWGGATIPMQASSVMRLQ